MHLLLEWWHAVIEFAVWAAQPVLAPFHYQFMCYGFITAILVGITCATLGTYVVLRQMAFIGDAMSHTALPGLVVAHLQGWSLFLGALVADLATALGIGVISRKQKVREDTAIGVLFTGMFAVGILLMSGSHAFQDLSHMLFGDILGVTWLDLKLIAGLTVVVLATLALLHKELELSSVDPGYAQVIGLRPGMLRFVLLFLLALTVVAGIQAVGVILTSALLVTPAATAAMLTRRFISMMVLASLIAVSSGIAGLYASYYFDMSSGAAIVVACTAIFAIVFACRAAVGRFGRRANA